MKRNLIIIIINIVVVVARPILIAAFDPRASHPRKVTGEQSFGVHSLFLSVFPL
jgi:hypothetical protein